MKILFFIGILFSFYSCSENKGQGGKVNHLIEPETPDSLLVGYDDSNVELESVMDKNLANGFEFPIRIISGSNFKYQLISDSTVKGIISASVVFKNNFNKPIEIVVPARGTIRSYKQDSSGFSFETYHKFLDNGKLKWVSVEVSGFDSTLYDLSDFEHMGPDQEYGVVGYLKPDKKNSKGELKIKLFFDENDKPFYSSSVEEFFKEYKKCLVPVNMDKLIFAHKSDYKMYYFEKGKLKKEFTIALSQNPIGHKQKQGDNKLPEGMYRITEKKLGPFGGEVGPWLGYAWMQFSYPNQYDAINGYKNGSITLAEKNAIVLADKNKKPTNSYTELGGRVGIHGWDGDWIANGTQNLTWGCISMFNRDIKELYEWVDLNTEIIIVP